jgi:hypothetical protein
MRFNVNSDMPSLNKNVLDRIRLMLRNLRHRLQHDMVLSQRCPKEDMKPKLAYLDFGEIYENNRFLGTESRSGGGSSLLQTRIIREEIPKLLDELKIHHLLDVPCGDWNWMRHVDLSGVQYTGGDIVGAILDKNNESFGTENCKFEYLNIVTGPLPKADLILCRDCLVHLNFGDGLAALDQVRKSGAKWLLTTTFTERNSNANLYEGDIWRPLNLEKPPYNLPKPERYINEGCTEDEGLFGDKCLGLWKLH